MRMTIPRRNWIGILLLAALIWVGILQAAHAQTISGSAASASTIDTVKVKAARLERCRREARPNALAGGGNSGYTVTVALSAAGAANPIASAVTYQVGSFTGGLRNFFDRNGGFFRQPSDAFRAQPRQMAPNTIYPNTHGAGIGFYTTAPQVGIRLMDFTDGALPVQVVARVNGEWVAASPTALPGTGTINAHWYTLSFKNVFGADYPAPRYIEIFTSVKGVTSDTSGSAFAVAVSQGHAIIPGSDPTVCRIGIIGNSYAFGQGPVNPRKNPAHQLGEQFGWRTDTIVSAVGGTGYATTQAVGPSGAAVKFIDLIPGLAQYGADYFDAIIVLGPLTNEGGQTPSNIQAAATAFFDALDLAFPGTPIIVTGPFRWTGNTMTTDRFAAEAAALAGRPLSRWAYIDTYQNNIQDPSATAMYAADLMHPSDLGGPDEAAKLTPLVDAELLRMAR